MKHSFYVRLEIEPDDDEISREAMHERLQSVFEHSSAKEALAAGLRSTITVELFSESTDRAELVAQAVEATEDDDDIQIDPDAVVSYCPDENYDWIMAWIAVYRED